MSYADGRFDVLWPQGPVDAPPTRLDARLDDLNGRRIGFVWDYVFRGDEMFPVIEEELRKRYPDVTFVPYERFGNIHGLESDAVLDELPARFAAEQLDGVIVGVGNCGSCTPAVVRSALIAERAGLPSVALVSSGFMAQARAIAGAMGAESTPIAEYPGVIPFDTAEELQRKMRENVLPAVLQGFAQPVALDEAPPVTIDVTSPVFSGSYDEVLEHFHANGWTDGLPITPPTVERVAEFLACTDRDPDEALGALAPKYHTATIRSVAVNGVMAGCKPEYMPILIAAVEAIADPAFHLEHAGATPGWEPMVILSGPIAKRLGFYSGTGALKVGHRPNTSVGRFLRMYFRNVAGWIPGETDKGTLGSGFHVAVAEDEDAIKAIGWEPSRVDRGFSIEDDVVTVQGVVVASIPVYSGGTTPEQLIGPLEHYMQSALGPWAFTSVWYGQSHALIVMSPAVAGQFARHGWSKADIRKRLFERLTVKASWIEEYPLHVAGQRVSLESLVRDGVVDESYIASEDPERLLPLLLREEWTNIVVAGDPGRNQSRIFYNNHEQGPPVSKRVELSEAWKVRVGDGAGAADAVNANGVRAAA